MEETQRGFKLCENYLKNAITKNAILKNVTIISGNLENNGHNLEHIITITQRELANRRKSESTQWDNELTVT